MKQFDAVSLRKSRGVMTPAFLRSAERFPWGVTIVAFTLTVQVFLASVSYAQLIVPKEVPLQKSPSSSGIVEPKPNENSITKGKVQKDKRVSAPSPVLPIVGGLLVSVNVEKANVKINGKDMGTATAEEPLRLEKLPAGDVTVEVSADGYEPLSKPVKIAEGKRTQEPFNLEKAKVEQEQPSAPSKQTEQGGETQAGETITIQLPGGIPLDLVWVPPGSLEMGNKLSAKQLMSTYGGNLEWYQNAYPLHKVTISHGFWLGKYEVTQGQWQAVMGTTPWKGQKSVPDDPDAPVVCVNWEDVQGFCRKAGQGTRLPSEAEWEYACQAGSRGEYCFGDSESELSNYAWYGKNTKAGEKRVHVVGQKQPNTWGLYDMHGNVSEWCQDWSHDSYDGAPTDGSAWESPSTQESSIGSCRVVRGGSFSHGAGTCRSSNRCAGQPACPQSFVGFRLLRTP